MVRAAFEWSITWDAPPVSFQMSQESMVPKAISPASARFRSSGWSSSSHAIFDAEN